MLAAPGMTEQGEVVAMSQGAPYIGRTSSLARLAKYWGNSAGCIEPGYFFCIDKG